MLKFSKLRSVRTRLRGIVIVVVVQLNELGLIRRNLIFWEDSVYWADWFTCCAVNAFIWADEKLVVARL